MEKTNKIFNRDLDLLVNFLNSVNIQATNINENSIEIFYNDYNKEIILSMLSRIDTCKNGFEFKKVKTDNQNIKSVIIKFNRNIDIYCRIIIEFLKSNKPSQWPNIFYKFDSILDSFEQDNTTLSIQKNLNIQNGLFAIFKTNLTREQIENKDCFVFNNKELESRIIHTIYSMNKDGSYTASLGLIFGDEDELDYLKNTDSKKLIKK